MALKPDMFVIGNVVSRARLPDGTPQIPAHGSHSGRRRALHQRPQWLAEHVLQGRHVLAVAGTHGKTTTTAMLTWILECAGCNPVFWWAGCP
jgi:UDP-N-acetylmuramate: L-alanyl-gamma-D-glutamyl-meso-diaminopimelate ligase